MPRASGTPGSGARKGRNEILDQLIGLLWRLGHWGYLIIFLGASLESAAFLGFLIPGETLVIVAGALAALGILDVTDLIILVAVAAMVGDNVSYLLGRHMGHPWLVRYGGRVGLDHARLDRVDRFYQRHGGAAVVFGRFISFLRALVPFVAGAAGMSYPRFVCFNGLAAALWAFSIVLLGYFLGDSWHIVQSWMGGSAFVVIAVVAAVFGLFWLRRRLAGSRAAPPEVGS